jgi:hypothetical protein
MRRGEEWLSRKEVGCDHEESGDWELFPASFRSSARRFGGCETSMRQPTFSHLQMEHRLTNLQNDAVLFISYSGKTPELLHLLHHIPESTPILAITAHTDASKCLLLQERPDAILLPAPIHELEEVSFGVCAPTTSTTVAIAVGDMLALTVAEAMHEEETKHVFKKNHPGGAIGDTARRAEVVVVEQTISLKRQKGLVSPA